MNHYQCNADYADPLQRCSARGRLMALRKQMGTTWREPESRWRVRTPIGATAHPQACMGYNGSTPVITSFDPQSMPVRMVYLAAVNHRGWFADCEGTGDRGVIQPVIAHLSHGRMLAGYHWTDNGDWVLFCDVTYTDVHEATSMADEHARVIAEQEQEYDAKFRAMVDAEGLVESHTTDVQDAIAARNTSARNREWARDAIENLRQSRLELVAATKAYES